MWLVHLGRCMFFIKRLQDPPVLKSFVLREMQSPCFSVQLGSFVKGKVLPFLSQAEDGDAGKTYGFVLLLLEEGTQEEEQSEADK